MECNKIARGAVLDSIHASLEETRQKFPLEKVSVLVANQKQTPDPKEAVKREVGRQQAEEYYSKRPISKGGMTLEMFGTDCVCVFVHAYSVALL